MLGGLRPAAQPVVKQPHPLAKHRRAPRKRLNIRNKVEDADIRNNQTALGRGAVNGTYEATVNILSVSYQHSF